MLNNNEKPGDSKQNKQTVTRNHWIKNSIRKKGKSHQKFSGDWRTSQSV